MALKYKTKGFVFKKKDTNESDRVFSVFTDDFGRLDIYAKAIRKIVSKLRNGIDIFFLSEIEFIQGKNKKTLTDSIKIKKFPDIAQDLEKLKIAGQIGDILDNFIKGEEKDKEVFNLINETFIKLNNSKIKTQNSKLLYYFLWNVLSILGYHSEVRTCADCHEKLMPHNLYFSGEEGGIICEKCLGGKKFAQKVNSDTVKILRIILSKDWQTLSRLKISPSSQKLLEEVSNNYYSHILSCNSFKNISIQV